MNLWINKKATHWVGDRLMCQYCVMDALFIVSDWYDTQAEAEIALNEIIEMARYAA